MTATRRRRRGSSGRGGAAAVFEQRHRLPSRFERQLRVGGASDLRGGSFVDIGVLEQSHFELQGQHALHGPVDLRFGDVARFRGLAE